MNMAIAYGMKKKARGGMMCAHGSKNCEMCHGGKMMAEGGEAEEEGTPEEGTPEEGTPRSEWSNIKFGNGYDKSRDLKGVHTSKFSETSGKSEAGIDYRRSKGADIPPGHRQYSPEQRLADSKRKHAQVLSEMKKMPHGKLYAEGGEVEDDDDDDTDMVGRIMSNRYPHDASGYGAIPEEREKEDEPAMGEDDRDLNQHGEYERGPEGMDEDNEPQHEAMYAHAEENQEFPEDEDDLVSRIMKQHQEHYSEGGQVANYTGREGDKGSAEYDDLVKDDDLESSYTGANSGDEIGNEHLEELMHDIVERVMRSRAKRDRNPVPA